MRKTNLILFIFYAACKQAYDPPVVSADHASLVVEGFINNGADSTVITLTRSFKLNDSAKTAPPELGAQVSVQGSDNSAYPLPELGNGQYGVPSLALNAALQYRLHIATTDGKQYQSDYTPLKVSPPIDSVNWINSANGVQLYVNTHDPQNASHYYRWDYVETWEFHSIYEPTLKYANDSLVFNLPEDDYYCWKSATPTNIILGNSTKLAQDLIYAQPLALIPPNSWEIGIEYSILVKQYVLTLDAYNFWQNLHTNTELIGSLFSPEPSAATGNMHCLTDSTVQVIGYVSAGAFSQQRIFITPGQIPNWIPEEYPDFCPLQTTRTLPDSLSFYFTGDAYLPIYWVDTGHSLVYYSYASCEDCTKTGSNVKPSFWP